MKILFNPSYSGFVYQNLENEPLKMDQKVCNTQALIDLLELHAGLHTEISDEIQRILDYCRAMKSYLAKNPESIFAASFKVDSFNTAKHCLSWRDSFVFSGWKGEGGTGNRRLDEMSAIEEYFSSPSVWERVINLTKEIKGGCPLPENLEIITPFDPECFPPLINELFNALKNRNCGIKIMAADGLPQNKNFLRKMSDVLINCKKDVLDLRQSDDSVGVWFFEEKNDALRYLSQIKDDSFDVWINRNNKSLDNYLSYSGKATCGCEDQGVTLLGSIPFMTLKLLERPLNLTSLVTYLGIPVSPFSKEFRDELQNKIIKSGGFFNDGCREILKKASEQDSKMAEIFLPDPDFSPDVLDENYRYSANYIEEFIQNIGSWLGDYLKSGRISNGVRNQLEISKSICSYMLSLLSINGAADYSYEELVLLFENLISEVTTEIYPAQKGCRNLINSPSGFAAVSPSTIWCDFYDPDEEVLSTEFMYPGEKKYLASSIWKNESEKAFNRYNSLLPFMFTKDKLVLVIVRKNGTQEVTKNPVIIRLMKNMGMNEEDFYSYAEHPDITQLEGIHTVASEKVNNHKQDEKGFVHFEHTELVKFKTDESFSSISNLIDNPFDYVMEKICGLKRSGEAAMSEVRTTKGTVAHAVIEELFNPSHGGTSADIKNQIDTRFDKVINQKLVESGGILLQSENLSDTEIFKKDMRTCVGRLLKIIEQNHLKVVECEQRHDNVSLRNFSACGITFTGSIDMVLEDNTGNYVIFDFKYTGNFSKYDELIKENRAMQLELYEELLKHKTNKLHSRKAYILLPDVKVITASDFDGIIFQVSPDPTSSELIQQMKNSYLYRKEQILSGNVEDGEGIDMVNLDYVNNQAADKRDLVLLGKDKNKKAYKEPNRYSSYKIFKAGE